MDDKFIVYWPPKALPSATATTLVQSTRYKVRSSGTRMFIISKNSAITQLIGLILAAADEAN